MRDSLYATEGYGTGNPCNPLESVACAGARLTAPHNVTANVTTKGQNMNAERIAELARRLMIARDTDPRPQTWRNAETELRAALGMPEPEPPPVKPWDR